MNQLNLSKWGGIKMTVKLVTPHTWVNSLMIKDSGPDWRINATEQLSSKAS